MDIIEVNTKRDLEKFIDFPWTVYKNDPNWVPPLKMDLRSRLDPQKHPFYLHGWAKKLIAVEGNRVLGRILVADDPRYNEENGTNQGTFGFFESIDDQNTANALLGRAGDLLKDRGRGRIFGPVEYSTNYECGSLIDGFDSPPVIMMGYNPPYYARLYENFGLTKNRDLFAWIFDLYNNTSDKWRPLLDRFDERYPIQIRSFDINRFDDDLKSCMQVYDCMRKNWWWACVSLTKAEIENYARRLRTIALPEQIFLAEADHKPVGFFVGLPDLNEAIRPLNGKLSWFGIPGLGILRLFHRLKHVKTGRTAVLCVLPEYQKRGIAERLIMESIARAKKHSEINRVELGWTDEKNDKINRIIERLGARHYKTYRVYEKNLEK
ncbi:MAG: GNAT family N-acetyltransferase [Planctomycetia bacterium]|nr:GNAT family N-acetyltransferase [Planctomycetia bacterium]